MNIAEKIKEINAEIKTIEAEVESKVVRLKLLKKAVKQFEKLLEKAETIDR